MLVDSNDETTNHATRLLENGPAVAYSAHGLYQFTFISPNVLQLLGYPATEFIENPRFWVDRIYPDDRNSVAANLAQLAEVGRIHHEYRVRHRSGAWRWLRDDVTLVRGDPDVPTDDAITGIWLDVTADVMALVESEDRLRDYAESAADWFWETDDQSRFVEAHGGREGEVPFSDASFLGKTRLEIADEETDTTKWRTHVATLEAQEPFRDFVYTRFDGEGRPRHISVSGRPVFDHEGTFKGYRGAGLDVTRQVEAEQAAHKSEARFRDLIETSNQGFLVHRFDGLLFANQAFADMLGYSNPAELLAVGSAKAWLPEDEQMRIKGYAEARSRGESAPLSYESRVIRKDGSNAWLENHSVSLEWGGKTAILGAFTDVTVRHEAQEALKKSELLHRSILDNMIDVYYRADVDGRLVMTSPSVKDLLGYDFQEGIGRSIADLYVEPGGRDAFQDALIASGGDLRDYEAEIWHQNGHKVWVSINGRYCYDAENTVIGVEGTLRDVTERKRLEQALSDSESQFRGLFENTKVGIVIRRGEKFIFANRAFAALFGYDEPADIMALHSFTEIITEEERDRIRQVHKRRERGETAEYLEYRGIQRDGSTVWIEQWVQRIVWEGEPAYLSFSMNITNRKEVEDHLKTARRLETIGKLAGGVAHEFNNLLTVVTGNLEFAEEILEGHAAEKYVDRAKKGALRGADLTHQLLAYSRRQPLQPIAIATDEVLQRAVAMMRPTLSGHIDIELAITDRLWDILVDPGRLEDALLNLAINARDASRQGGTIRIAGGNVNLGKTQIDRPEPLPAGDYVAIRVTDSGTGMDIDVAQRATEPFFTTKDVGEGTGLGLSMVYGFAKQSGGDVDIETAIGQGTSVTLYLPRAEDTAKTAASADMERLSPTGSGTILVVEDDAEVRDLTEALVNSLGYTVIVADDAQSGLAILESDSRVDLLLTDIMMPKGIDGFKLVDRARAHNPNLKVVFATGYDSATIAAEKRIERSNTRLLVKPYRRSDVAQVLHDLLS